MTGNAKTNSWFQKMVSVTASPTAIRERPQERNIANDAAMPIGAPPGTPA
jgi:hypothetical protein